MAENIKPPTTTPSKTSVTPSTVHAQRMSFASIVAMAPPGQSRSRAEQGNPLDNADQESYRYKNGHESPSIKVNQSCLSRSPPIVSGLEDNPRAEAGSVLERSLNRLVVKEDQALVPDVSENEISTTSLTMRPKLDDEKTHLSFSSTKAPSLDGKSVASGTTFAMDEKESIRPDDSASVMAAEDDDSNSGPASGDPNSRFGSEAGSKAFRDQFHEISERMGSSNSRPLPPSRRLVPGMIEELRRGPPSQVATMGSPANLSRPDSGIVSNVAMEYKYHDPDEKLLEAMETPKDRLFLLQLEQQVISFIQDSNESVLDLPPCNSFCRLLAHRLGDYYALSHYVDNSVSAVRLYRTPFCQLRTPLSEFINKTVLLTEEGPAVAPSMKIMRRAGMAADGQISGSGPNTMDNSVGPSKSASENGDDSQKASGITSPTDFLNPKDKTAATREEREAKYKEARDRIFADWKEGEKSETTQTDEIINDASRTSSATGKKKKKNSKNDDGFDSRSAYNAYYPQRSGSLYDQSTSHANFYNPYVQQGDGQPLQPAFQPPFGQSYQHMPQVQGYQTPQMSMPPQNQIVVNPSVYQQPGIQPQFLGYNQPVPVQYYPPPQQTSPMATLPPIMSSPALSNVATTPAQPQSQLPDHTWVSNTYQNPYPVFSGNQSPYQTHVQPSIAPSHITSTVSYAYGQLPYQPNGHAARSVHPVPGSYHRQSFNPHSRSFIPGNAFATPATTATNITDRPGEANTYRPHLGFSGSLSPKPFPLPHMAPLSSAAQLTSPFQSQHSSPRKPSGQVPRSQSPGQSTLSKWGTPSTLPPKPPPPASSNLPGGVPTFQNGTYTKPNSTQAETKMSIGSMAVD